MTGAYRHPMTATEIPAIADKFANDARDQGWTVTIDAKTDGFVTLWAEKGDNNVSLTWHTVPVYHGTLAQERLGFRTHAPARYAIRFADGTVKVHGVYTAVRSVRHARGLVGLYI